MSLNPLHLVNPNYGYLDPDATESHLPPNPRPFMSLFSKRFIDGATTADSAGEILRLSEDYKNSYQNSQGVGMLVSSSGNHYIGVVGYDAVNDSEAVRYTAGDSVVARIKDTTIWVAGAVFMDQRYNLTTGRHLDSILRIKPEFYLNGDQSNLETIEADIMFHRRYIPGMDVHMTKAVDENHRTVSSVMDAYASYMEAMYQRDTAFMGVQMQAHRRGWGDKPRKKLEDKGHIMPQPRIHMVASGRGVVNPQITGDRISGEITNFNYTFNWYDSSRESMVNRLISERFHRDSGYERTLDFISNLNASQVIIGLR